ncbi:MAG TPA: hypothetical protein VFC57_07220 [Aeromicrobium sp.]|nr:hypothetical protein [Aeromicrobium sp.]
MNILHELRDNPIAALVVACEVSFWLFLLAAVVARYVVKLIRLSTVLLLCEPLIEVVLLVATIFDLARGNEANWSHGLAAVYLGFTVAFGKQLVQAVDVRVAHRFAGGRPPPKPPKYGAARVRHEWREWLRCLFAWAISCTLIGVLLLFTNSPDQRDVLLRWVGTPTIVTGAWLVFGPLWVTIWPPRAPTPKRQNQ